MIWPIGEALLLGMATTLNPCPLAAGMAAVAFIGRRLGHPRQVFLAGILYGLGGTITYAALALLLLAGIRASPLAWLLERYVHQAMGPVLILLGMLLVDLIRLPGVNLKLDEPFHARIERRGLWAALPLGMFFALAMCPASAAVFFGSLFHIAAGHGSWPLLAVAYGLGTALPVVLLAALLAFAAGMVGKVFGILAGVARWAQRLAGTLLILIGVYCSLRYIFELF
jgi:cytochrome c biogenesis protein CcdA